MRMSQLAYEITGGAAWSGKVSIPGAKNASLPCLAASVLIANQKSTLQRVPDVSDIREMLGLLRHYGVTSHSDAPGRHTLDASQLNACAIPNPKANFLRGSVLLLGPLLARGQRVRLAWPGGCAIGKRPIDLHLEGLKALGANIQCGVEYIDASAPQGLKGNTVTFPAATVGGTENIMMAACLAQGQTVIENAACEPEIVDLAGFLNACGARIEGAGTPTITITGVKALYGATHTMMPDRIIAGTYLVAAAVTKGKIWLGDVNSNHLSAVLDLLIASGLKIEVGQQDIQVQASDKPFEAMSFETGVYPAIPTDMQALLTVYNIFGRGDFCIRETIFENRFAHVEPLNLCGANLSVEEDTIRGQGQQTLHAGEILYATDLRAGAALVIFAHGLRGVSTVTPSRHVERGYPAFLETCNGLGGSVREIANPATAPDVCKLRESYFSFFYPANPQVVLSEAPLVSGRRPSR